MMRRLIFASFITNFDHDEWKFISRYLLTKRSDGGSTHWIRRRKEEKTRRREEEEKKTRRQDEKTRREDKKTRRKREDKI
ncbi:hypothetical protein QE152_g7544 [Popillia japonica]|uniref:Uncharacterized protein n=1 Tax=Popillia japonica TaxID=7064 RepID=A0AAW1MFF5_POPJA